MLCWCPEYEMWENKRYSRWLPGFWPGQVGKWRYTVLNWDSKACRRYRIGRNNFMLDILSLRCQLDNQVEMLAVRYVKLISGGQRRGLGWDKKLGVESYRWSSRTFHDVANDRISFLWLNDIPLYRSHFLYPFILEDIMLWNKPGRQILHVLTYMWNLKGTNS